MAGAVRSSRFHISYKSAKALAATELNTNDGIGNFFRQIAFLAGDYLNRASEKVILSIFLENASTSSECALEVVDTLRLVDIIYCFILAVWEVKLWIKRTPMRDINYRTASKICGD